MKIFEIDLTAGGYIECRDYEYACSLWSSSCCSCKRSTKSKFGKLCSGSWVSSNYIDWFFYGLGRPAAKTWPFTNLHFVYMFIYQCTFWFHIYFNELILIYYIYLGVFVHFGLYFFIHFIVCQTNYFFAHFLQLLRYFVLFSFQFTQLSIQILQILLQDLDVFPPSYRD